MRFMTVLWINVILFSAIDAYASAPTKESSPQSAGQGDHIPQASSQAASGRFQLIAIPGHSGSPFLIDTTTGCVWHQVQNQDTKRTTFVEVDVENLHWSWGSGAQQVLASRVDGANIPDEQKRLLKESLQRTACGLSNVVLTPGPPSSAGQSKP